MFLLSAPVGVLFGYVLTTIFISIASWEFAFYVQAASAIPFIAFFLMIPLKYVAIDSEMPNLDKEKMSVIPNDIKSVDT